MVTFEYFLKKISTITSTYMTYFFRQVKTNMGSFNMKSLYLIAQNGKNYEVTIT